MNENSIKILNVGLLSLAFLLIFTAFGPMANVQTVILDSASNKSSEGLTYNSYIKTNYIVKNSCLSMFSVHALLFLMGHSGMRASKIILQ